MVSFDERINRSNTDSLKYDFHEEFKMPLDAIPLWVADMDFRAPEKVLDALRERVDHGIFGYSDVKQDYYEALIGWFERFFDFNIQQQWVVKSPGVVFGLNHAIRAYSAEGDSVLIQQPVYRPFSNAVLNNKRKLVSNQLVLNNGRYEINFEDFEEQIVKNKVKLFILCSPHNPVGRVWTKEELTRMGEICLAHQVIVIADEIHCDFTWEGHPHTVFASIQESFAQNCVVCTAPSKTFNLAGLQISNLVIPNEELRRRVREQFEITGVDEINALGLTACRAAYRYGEEWLSELKEYLMKNLEIIRNYLNTELPQVKIIEPEGTYLLWLDFSGLGLSKEELKKLITQEARIWLDDGVKFGEDSGQFYRWNMTCPASLIQEALERLGEAVQNVRLG